MAETADQLLARLAEALDAIDKEPGKADTILGPLLYTPNAHLKALLAELEVFVAKDNPTKEERKAAGTLLERIAFAVFSGLRPESIQNYQSTGAQIDLLVNGDGVRWQSLTRYLRIDPVRRGILVEAKAVQAKVSTAQFLRLCGLMTVNFPTSVSLGVFLTINGAAGFPEDATRLRVARDARYEQVLFMASDKRPVVVLDLQDIRALGEAGSLVRILSAKIREIEAASGLSLSGDTSMALQADLPAHMADLLARPPTL